MPQLLLKKMPITGKGHVFDIDFNKRMKLGGRHHDVLGIY